MQVLASVFFIPFSLKSSVQEGKKLLCVLNKYIHEAIFIYILNRVREINLYK